MANENDDVPKKKDTPFWDWSVEDYRRWFYGAFGGDASPFETFEVFVEVKDRELYRLKEHQADLILWALSWMMDGARLSEADVISRVANECSFKEDDRERILSLFFEHGRDKLKNVDDESYHPFIHHLLLACDCCGKLVVKRILGDAEVLEGLMKELAGTSGLVWDEINTVFRGCECITR